MANITSETTSPQIWTILTDRSQGGTKLKSNEIEIMVHRRLFKDDDFGVFEALNEYAFGSPLVTRGKHYILRSDHDAPIKRRQKAQELYLGPITMFQSTEISAEDWIADNLRSKEFSALRKGLGLPASLNLMTIEFLDSDLLKSTLEVLMRFENMLEAKEGGKIEHIMIPDDFLVGFKIIDISELALGGDRPISEVTEKLKWGKNAEQVKI